MSDDPLQPESDIAIPEFLRRGAAAQKAVTIILEEHQNMTEENTSVEQQTENKPPELSVEQLAEAIRKLTVDIDKKTEERAKLRNALKKMVGDL